MVNIHPRIRAKLDQLGVETVRRKLVSIMARARGDDRESIGDGLSVSRREMREWLIQKTARELRWVKAAVVAAMIALLAAGISLVAWRFPVTW
jgi:hypothetical protein